MAYSDRTSFYGIPIPITDDTLSEEENIQQMNVCDWLLQAANGIIGSGVIEEGEFIEVPDNGTGRKVILQSSGGVSLSAILKDGLAKTRSQIAWERLQNGNFYYLYVYYTIYLYENVQKFNVAALLSQVPVTDHNYLLLATYDLTDSVNPILDIKPEGKAYARDYIKHISDQSNPHGLTWTQTNLMVDGSLNVNFIIPQSSSSSSSIGPIQPSKAFVCGGNNSVSPYYYQDCDSYDGSIWTTETDMPLPARTESKASTINDKIYLYAGRGYGVGYLVQCDSYDGVSWISEVDLPSPARAYHAASTIGSKGYVYGGYASGIGYISQCDSYDGIMWYSEVDIPSPLRGQFAASTRNNRGHIYGGYDLSAASFSRECQSYGGIFWISEVDTPTPGRSIAGASTVQLSAFLYGGNPGSLQDCDSYNGVSWFGETDMPIPGRYGFGASSLNLKIYSFGGYTNSPPYILQDNDSYDKIVWTSEIDVPLPSRQRSAAASIGGYDPGGSPTLNFPKINNFDQSNVSSTNPLFLLSHANPTVPLLKTDEEFRISDARASSILLSEVGEFPFNNGRLSIVGAINENTQNLGINISDISTNTSNISTNIVNISSNDSDISVNESNITSNSADISSNASDILQNTTDISTNSLNISNNTLSILNNSSSITGNAFDITNNRTNIHDNINDIASITGQINTNTLNVGIQSTQLNDIRVRVEDLECVVFGICPSSSSSSSSFSSSSSSSIEPISPLVFYGVQKNSPAGLYKIDDPDTGASTFVGNTNISNVSAATIDPISELMYITTGVGGYWYGSSDLYSVDLDTANATNIASFNASFIFYAVPGLACNDSGDLYAIVSTYYGTKLALVDKNTATLTEIGDTGLGYGYGNGIAFLDGILYYASYTYSGRNLYTIDVNTGVATLVTSMTSVNIPDMASYNNELYAARNGSFYRLNKVTGVLTTLPTPFSSINGIAALSFANAYSVVGAGVTESNGKYCRVGTRHGKSLYKKSDEDWWIYWDNDYGGYWYINNNLKHDEQFTMYYHPTSQDDEPPLTGWADNSSEFPPSVPPAPTLERDYCEEDLFNSSSSSSL